MDCESLGTKLARVVSGSHLHGGGNHSNQLTTEERDVELIVQRMTLEMFSFMVLISWSTHIRICKLLDEENLVLRQK